MSTHVHTHTHTRMYAHTHVHTNSYKDMERGFLMETRNKEMQSFEEITTDDMVRRRCLVQNAYEIKCIYARHKHMHGRMCTRGDN